MNHDREDLCFPSPRARVAFWGFRARLVLPAEQGEVDLEYVTEPPHGDPLFKIIVDRVTVGGWKAPLLCFGRDLHLSPCARFFAFTSLRLNASRFHVLDLACKRLWSKQGFVSIEGVLPTEIRIRDYSVPDRIHVVPGPARSILLGDTDWIEPLYTEFP